MDLGLILVAVMIAVVLFTLLTGKALSPTGGHKPLVMVVTRWDHPRRYWSVVALLAGLLVLLTWVQTSGGG
jgi:hypothetical protein